MEEKAREESAAAILSEGLSPEQVQAEKEAQERERLAAQEAEDERLTKTALSLMKKIPIKKTYLKIVNPKDLDETKEKIDEYLSQLNKFTEDYFRQQYKPYSFIEENFERGQKPEAKRLYIISVILSRMAAINKFPVEYRQQILNSTKAFNTIFSNSLKPLLDRVSVIIQQLDAYKNMIQNIKEINERKTKKS